MICEKNIAADGRSSFFIVKSSKIFMSESTSWISLLIGSNVPWVVLSKIAKRIEIPTELWLSWQPIEKT